MLPSVCTRQDQHADCFIEREDEPARRGFENHRFVTISYFLFFVFPISHFLIVLFSRFLIFS